MAVGTVGRPQSVILKIVESAGSHPTQGAAVERWCLCLYVVSPLRVGAFLLLWARISRGYQQRGHDRRSYYVDEIFLHLGNPLRAAPVRREKAPRRSGASGMTNAQRASEQLNSKSHPRSGQEKSRNHIPHQRVMALGAPIAAGLLALRFDATGPVSRLLGTKEEAGIQTLFPRPSCSLCPWGFGPELPSSRSNGLAERLAPPGLRAGASCASRQARAVPSAVRFTSPVVARNKSSAAPLIRRACWPRWGHVSAGMATPPSCGRQAFLPLRRMPRHETAKLGPGLQRR